MKTVLIAAASPLLGACAITGGAMRIVQGQVRVTEHRHADDLLTAGLGGSGLCSMQAPAFADPAKPMAAELRRRAIWSSWRGIADLSVRWLWRALRQSG